MKKTESSGQFSTCRRLREQSLFSLFNSLVLACSILSCTSGGGDLADNGGMSGTGISQGEVSAFGSIFVNGVEWDLSGATIEIDGTPATEADLRVGMVVRIEGDFDAGGLTGTATAVRFDDSIEGPILGAPVETIPGVEKTFTVLGQNVRVNIDTTLFDSGASFAGLAMDQVVEVSGFVDSLGEIEATRVELKGVFPFPTTDVELRGRVMNLVKNPDGSGIFDLGPIVVRYTAGTSFSDVTRATLVDGNRVEVEGTLRVSGNEIDADEIELETAGFGAGNAPLVQVEGIAVACPESTDFCVEGVPIDTSGAMFVPMSFTPMVGDAVEVRGPLVAGTLVANRVKSEEEDPTSSRSRIHGRVTSVDAPARTLVILGVTVSADGSTRIRDQSVVDDETFMFGEILPGDFLEIRGFETGPSAVRAARIDRDDAIDGVDDVRFEGPVTAIDAMTPGISILGQAMPIDPGTLYFDEMGDALTEMEFFGMTGNVMLGDIVRATDLAATDLSTLAEVDEMEMEEP